MTVEDLYRPYRPKRRTRATIAKEKGSGASGRADLAAEDEQNLWKSAAEAIYFRRKRRSDRGGGACRSAEIFMAESISDEADYRMLHPRDDDEEGNASYPQQKTRRQSRFMRCIMTYEEPVNKAGRTPDSGAEPRRKGEDS